MPAAPPLQAQRGLLSFFGREFRAFLRFLVLSVAALVLDSLCFTRGKHKSGYEDEGEYEYEKTKTHGWAVRINDYRNLRHQLVPVDEGRRAEIPGLHLAAVTGDAEFTPDVAILGNGGGDEGADAGFLE